MGKLLEGKTAIITGAGHPLGIGAAIARKLAGAGANIVVTDVPSPDTPDTPLAQLEERVTEIAVSGGKAVAVNVDVTDEAQIRHCVEQALEAFGSLDILVNNAGVSAGANKFMELSIAHLDLSYNVNLKGVALFSQAAIPHLLKSDAGAIVNVASLCGLGAIETIPVNYTATKFGVVGLTKGIAQEFADQGLRVNAVCPGVVDTQMRRNAIARIAELHDVSAEEAERLEDDSIAMKRAASADEIADAVLYLASPSASYITGVALPVAGGLPPGL